MEEMIIMTLRDQTKWSKLLARSEKHITCIFVPDINLQAIMMQVPTH